MTLPSCAVVIPARGGSKGIPGKNLRLVNSRSLIVRAVEAARGAKSVGLVTVSTDDAAIAEAGRAAGAQIIDRPAEISGDRASSEAAVLHALEQMAREERLPEVVILMQCTSPFTRAAHIDALIETLAGKAAACAFSVVEDHGFLWGLDAAGFAVGINHDHTGRRRMRQELPPQFRENGALYAMRVEAFRRTGNRFCGPAVPVPMHAPHLEIDEEADLTICDAVARVLDR
jgi:CMP-N-acetylneuraminic acid synthetase